MTTILTIAVRAEPERLADFRILLAQVQRELPATKGCRNLRILSAQDDPTAITLAETWSSRARRTRPLSPTWSPRAAGTL